MNGKPWIAALGALLALPIPAVAQVSSLPAPDPATSAVVQELEVIGRRPGPALWTVKRGDATVVVVGALTPLPHMLDWDTTRVERAMDGADLVLLPPRGRPGVLDIVSIFLHGADAYLPRGRSVYDEMTPDEKARFENLRVQAKTETKRYASLKPALAGVRLLSDFRKAAGLSDAKPASTIEHLAQVHHIRVKTVGEFKLAGLFRAITHMTPEQNRDCLDAAIADAEREAQHGQDLARAWADGDLKTVTATYRGALMDRCVLEAPSLQAALEKGMNQGMAEVNAALSRPGKTVLVVDLGLLFRPNGLLDQLRAEGDEVKTPPD